MYHFVARLKIFIAIYPPAVCEHLRVPERVFGVFFLQNRTTVTYVKTGLNYVFWSEALFLVGV